MPQPTTVEGWMAHIELAADETVLDMGGEISKDEIMSDLVAAIAGWEIPDVPTAREVCRRMLGYVPMDATARLGNLDWME